MELPYLKDETVLLVEDNEVVADATARGLRAAGAEVFQAATVAAGEAFARQREIDLALLDLNLPDGSGLDLLAWLRERNAELPVIMLTAYGNVRAAVAAMRLGAVDFLEKPFAPEDLELAIERAMTLDALRREIRTLRRVVGGGGPVVRGESRAMRAVWEQVERVAPTDATVLITGESGTGKEVVARAVHAASARAGGPFIPVNCGGIPETLVEDHLFGHEAFAFTDGRTLRRGDFELAEKGTIFLDEIGEMPLAAQPKLLRVLEDRRYTRIGGERELRADVRMIAATNRDLEEAVAAGAFRPDMLFRLKVFTIQMPPLRERREDIPLLVAAFLRDVGQQVGKPRRRVAPATLRLLAAYAWPGNVRQLRNVLEYALILCQGAELLPEHLPPELGGRREIPLAAPDPDTQWERWLEVAPTADLTLDSFAERVERSLVARALRQSNGVRVDAARSLGLSPENLRYRINKHGLRDGEPSRERGA